jgi:hypothetical protein
MQAVAGLAAADAEAARAAGDALKLLCRASADHARMALSLVRMPLLLRLLPEMAHSAGLQPLVGRIYADALAGGADARRVVKGVALYAARLGAFPPPLFRALRAFLGRCADPALLAFCCEALARCGRCLAPPQVRDVGLLAVDALAAQGDAPGLQRALLALLAQLKLADARLYGVRAQTFGNLALLVACFPRRAPSGDEAVRRVRDSLDLPLAEDMCQLLFSTLAEFIPHLADDSHAILVETVIPSIIRRGAPYQVAVAAFFSAIPMELESIYVMDFGSVALCSQLKAASLRLHYLASVPPNILVDVSDCYDTGLALFSIGEYSQAVKSFAMCKNDIRADAYQYLARGEFESRNLNHSLAAQHFLFAKYAFQMTKFPHDFHVLYCEARFAHESILFQAEVLTDSGISSLAGLITDSDLLAHAAFRLRRASLAVHPAVDAISCELTTQFCDRVTAVAQAVDDGEPILPIEIIPPPALLREDPPVVVERIEIVDPTLVLQASHATAFMVGVTGTIRCETDLPLKLKCELAFPRAGGMASGGMEDIPLNGEFEIVFHIQIESVENGASMQLAITVVAWDGEVQYLVGDFRRCVGVRDPTAE